MVEVGFKYSSDSKAYTVYLRIGCSLRVLQMTCWVIQYARVIWVCDFWMRFSTISKSRERAKMGKRSVRFIQFYYWEVICNLMRFGRVVLPGPFWFLDIIPITLEGRRPYLRLSCPVFSLAGVRQSCCLWELVCVTVCGSDQMGCVFSGVILPMERGYMFVKEQKPAS